MTQTFNVRLPPVAIPSMGNSTDLFTVTGTVVVTSLFGYVTTAVEPANDPGHTNGSFQVVFTPAVGSAATLCNLAGSNDIELPVDTLVIPPTSVAGSGELQSPTVLSTGGVAVEASGTYPPSGAIQWQVNWYPLTPGASVAAA